MAGAMASGGGTGGVLVGWDRAVLRRGPGLVDVATGCLTSEVAPGRPSGTNDMTVNRSLVFSTPVASRATVRISLTTSAKSIL